MLIDSPHVYHSYQDFCTSSQFCLCLLHIGHRHLHTWWVKQSALFALVLELRLCMTGCILDYRTAVATIV